MSEPAPTSLTARLLPCVGACPAAAWDALSDGANPFVTHAFLTALEDSQSVDTGAGAMPGGGG